MKSREYFLRKVSVCILTDLNPGFDGPWKKLWIFFVNGTFIMPQKKSFGKKNFLNFMHAFKSAILAEWKNCQNGTFEPVHEIHKTFLPKDFFWGIKKVPFTKSIRNFFQGPSNPGFRYVIVQTETFPKKDSRDFKNSFLFRYLWIPSKTGEQN